MKTYTGILFDCYAVEEKIHLWLLTKQGMQFFHEPFFPILYVYGKQVASFVKWLEKENALKENPRIVKKRLFYSQKEIKVWQLVILRPSVLAKLKRRLFAWQDKVQIFHADFELAPMYLESKQLYPLANIEIQANMRHEILQIQCLSSLSNIAESLQEIPLKYAKLFLEKPARTNLFQNTLCLEADGSLQKFSLQNKHFLAEFFTAFEQIQPDCIFTEYGDQIIFPYLFSRIQKENFRNFLDRDVLRGSRRILTQGKSFFSYGNIIYRAPAYPLFGRWHIDIKNSFLYHYGGLTGILEIARISGFSVQRAARASTGLALTWMQSKTALKKGYLVPWQKSALEKPKSALELLQADKGSLVFDPEIRKDVLPPHPKKLFRSGGIFENAAQIDFSQMYPSIMVLYNISPETVNCSCCPQSQHRVPETNTPICQKRTGIVPETLAPILKRREQLKQLSKDNHKAKECQDALKMLLVTSFGYLGYRNAKFGRLESHEAVTAYGREILLTAKEICEKQNYYVIHGITDCLFLQHNKEKITTEKIQNLCEEISRTTKITMSLDCLYSWVVFLPSKQNSKKATANRYFGRLENGTIKLRGLFLRRKDIPPFIKKCQQEYLDLLSTASTVQEVLSLKNEIFRLWKSHEETLQQYKVPWQELLFRKSLTKDASDYKTNGISKIVTQQLSKERVHLQAGQKIRYLLVDKMRYSAIPEEKVSGKERYAVKEYQKLLEKAFLEVWLPFEPD
ncbi:MAG: DNA polymerase, partial [Candidatus Hydrogenedentota bacterium]